MRPNQPVNAPAWREFVQDALGRFWLDLYTTESTLAELTAAVGTLPTVHFGFV